ncbi:Hypothetical protein R9X50_00050300 [Acrodontium crateriforme]|uniref:TRIP4/RQT4 C2HC5-type zinc finger domain-containing protein n=1 Tax=Acrodontium crateriforme TaxID=150365 RepID=A0AAQ3LXZ2_9PEZI|nr:Hypothetical protein R9X50_00050300 [Acrodontium crateriforme]
MAATSTQLETWAIPQLRLLLPLDDDSLAQIVLYAHTLSKEAAADHLKNLLGDGARALEFIAGFNLRRVDAPSTAHSAPNASSTAHSAPNGTASSRAQSQHTSKDRQRTNSPASGSEVPRNTRAGRGGKKKAIIHALPARQVQGHGDVSRAYRKHEETDYMPMAARTRPSHKEQVADNLALREKRPVDAMQMPLITGDAGSTSTPTASKAPPSAAGPLISDMLAPRKTTSSHSSRTASPAPKTKVNISGGTAMHGASTALSDLDSAIRSLEVQTNPTLSGTSPADEAKRQCNCMATRHPLLEIAPNCLNCGKVICIKQGLGPCTFCHSPLLSADEISKVLRVLKDERGEERMKANNASHKKADVAHGKARAFTGRDFLAQVSSSPRSSPLSSTPITPVDSDSEPSAKAAQAHRDKLLAFQANNAQRTHIHDEAADYDIPTSGTNMWASPAERAKQLKQQQKLLREIEWSARPDFEKRQIVASIDVKGGRIVKTMAHVPMPDFTPDDQEEPETDFLPPVPTSQPAGSFSANPLAAGLIRPLAREHKGKQPVEAREQKNTWRRTPSQTLLKFRKPPWLTSKVCVNYASKTEQCRQEIDDVARRFHKRLWFDLFSNSLAFLSINFPQVAVQVAKVCWENECDSYARGIINQPSNAEDTYCSKIPTQDEVDGICTVSFDQKV